MASRRGVSRLSNVELARRVGLSATPCLERVKKLEREGYILGYKAVVDPAKLGKNVQPALFTVLQFVIASFRMVTSCSIAPMIPTFITLSFDKNLSWREYTTLRQYVVLFD